MGLADLEYATSYRTPKDDIPKIFLVPSLSEAIKYDRAVGFFSSTALTSLTVGIKKMVEKKGKIRILCSPRLSDEDIHAITVGYKSRNDVLKDMETVFDNEVENIDDKFTEERLNILAHLISDGILDIKIAFPLVEDDTAMYHEKIGIIEDEEHNFVAFSGSMNDSYNAYRCNIEHIDVYTSFSYDYRRAMEKKQLFESMWNNSESGVEVIDFPENLKQKIDEFKKEKVNYSIDEEEFEEQECIDVPMLPKWLKVFDYQEEAYEQWKNKDFSGIYDMATGTGKTITALVSATRLLHLKKRLAIIICCPYQHLVEQWCEDLDEFNYKYIVGYSGSKIPKWKEKLKREVFDYSYNVSDYFCFITTNASFGTNSVQTILSELKGQVLLIVDEAHNFGTQRLLSCLTEKYTYRLALSATIDRHNDIYGTQCLYDYFRGKCFEYSLEKAIAEDKLTPYEYHPIKVYLSEEELEKYNELSEKIIKFITTDDSGNLKLKKGAEMLLIKRARIVAGAQMKLDVLREVMEPYKDDNHILVYCGATTVHDSDYGKKESYSDDVRQIEAVQSILANELGMKVAQFTSEEDIYQRQVIKDDFDEGKLIQALVAIRCLDEGVNIPSIDKAFILASSTNPKEYVQRRGRVLRKFFGKTHSIIYDFVTLPRNLDEVLATDDMTFDLSLIKRELIRVKDFAKLSVNPYEAEALIEEIENVYGYIQEGNTNGIY